MRKLLRSGYTALRRVLWRWGFDLVRLAPHDPKRAGAKHDDARALPPGAEEILRSDHPRLLELRRRYAASSLPMAQRTMWGARYLEKELDLRQFRGDNAYVWQLRNVRQQERYKYYVYLRDIAARDPQGLLRRLHEDGLFGCWAFDYPGWPTVSRDLLDSINEIYFLDRHIGLFDRPGFSVLDIGAGYGRLGHRMVSAVPGIGAYLCTDAVPESTFLCEYYLRFRGVDSRTEVLPLDEVDDRLAGRRIDLAINTHSFSEMSRAAIAGWLERLRRTSIPWLLVVPNDAGQLLTIEADGTRADFTALFAEYGYELQVREPVFSDPTLREFLGIRDFFFLFRRE